MLLPFTTGIIDIIKILSWRWSSDVSSVNGYSNERVDVTNNANITVTG